MGARALAFFDTVLAIESRDEHALTWLDEVLAPWFERPTREPELRVTVRHTRDVAATPAGGLGASSPVPFLGLDSRVIHLPASRQGSRILLEDAAEGCRYTLDGLDVSVEARDNPGRLSLMRVVREIAVEHERRHASSLELHAAALELGGQAIALVGPKGSGKTTLLLHALACHPARMVANDRVLVDTWTGQTRVTGVPAVIRIPPRTAASFPALASSLPLGDGPWSLTLDEARRARAVSGLAEAGTELRLSAAQLATALPASIRAAAPLRAVVFPEIEAGGDAPRLSGLARETARERLRANIYGGDEREVPTVFTELVTAVCRRSGTADEIRHAKAELAARLAADVPCVRLRPGPRLESAIDLLLRHALG